MAMTRETKVGIGVSCTFACLVSLIVGFKMWEDPADEQPTDGTTQVARAEPAQPPNPVEPGNPTPSSVPPPLPPPAPPTEKVEPPTGAPPVPTPAEKSPVPPPPVPDKPFQPNLASPPTPSAVPLPPEPKAKEEPGVKVAPVVANTTEREQLLFPPAPGGPDEVMVVLGSESPAPTETHSPSVSLPPLVPPVAEPPAVTAPAVPAPVPAPPTAPASPVVPAAPVDVKPVPVKLIPAPPEAPTAPVAAATLQPPVRSTFEEAPKPTVTKPVAPVPVAIAPTPAPTTDKGNRVVFSGDGVNPTPLPAEPKPGPIPGPPNTIEQTNLTRLDTTPRVAPVAAKVTFHRIDMVATQQAVTFEDLSVAHYGKKEYAAALVQFNQDNGGAVAGPNGAVGKGQKVYFPEEAYFKPETPAPLPVVTPIVVAPRGKVTSAYEVPAGGESLMTIARNDSEHAKAIMALNPSIASVTDLVPAGTLLRLPPETASQSNSPSH